MLNIEGGFNTNLHTAKKKLNLSFRVHYNVNFGHIFFFGDQPAGGRPPQRPPLTLYKKVQSTMGKKIQKVQWGSTGRRPGPPLTLRVDFTPTFIQPKKKKRIYPSVYIKMSTSVIFSSLGINRPPARPPPKPTAGSASATVIDPLVSR